MKGISIEVRGGTPPDCAGDREFITFVIAGQDRKRTIEACAAKLPESLRAGLRQQFGRALEHENEQLTAQVSGEDYAVCLAILIPCEVVA